MNDNLIRNYFSFYSIRFVGLVRNYFSFYSICFVGLSAEVKHVYHFHELQFLSELNVGDKN